MRPIARTSNLVVQEASGETLIYDLENNKAFCLNATSSIVLKHCDGRSNLTEIAASISGKLDTPVTEETVWLALNQLDREGLLKDFDDSGSTFNGMSRRDVVKKIGFGSMVALPIVSSIVAPRAAFAQSCVGPGTLPSGNFLGCLNPADPTACSNAGANQCCSGNASIGVMGGFCPPGTGFECRCD